MWCLPCRIAIPAGDIVATLRGLNALEEPLNGHINDHHQAAFVQPHCNPRACTRLCRVCVCGVCVCMCVLLSLYHTYHSLPQRIPPTHTLPHTLPCPQAPTRHNGPQARAPKVYPPPTRPHTKAHLNFYSCSTIPSLIVCPLRHVASAA